MRESNLLWRLFVGSLVWRWWYTITWRYRTEEARDWHFSLGLLWTRGVIPGLWLLSVLHKCRTVFVLQKFDMAEWCLIEFDIPWPTHLTLMGREIYTQFWSECCEEGHQLGDLCIDGRIILKGILVKYDMKMWTRFSQFKIESDCRILWTRWWNFWFLKAGIFLTSWVSNFQAGLYTMESQCRSFLTTYTGKR